MENKEILEKIKTNVSKILKRNGINKFSIYLFGSRAINQADEYSDYDILVVVDRQLSSKKRFNIFGKILWSLRGTFNSFDIVIKSEKDFEEEKEVVGSLIYGIKDEAIAI